MLEADRKVSDDASRPAFPASANITVKQDGIMQNERKIRVKDSLYMTF